MCIRDRQVTPHKRRPTPDAGRSVEPERCPRCASLWLAVSSRSARWRGWCRRSTGGTMMSYRPPEQKVQALELLRRSSILLLQPQTNATSCSSSPPLQPDQLLTPSIAEDGHSATRPRTGPSEQGLHL